MLSPSKTHQTDLVAESSASESEEHQQVKMMKAFLEKLKEERRLIFSEPAPSAKPEPRSKKAAPSYKYDLREQFQTTQLNGK